MYACGRIAGDIHCPQHRCGVDPGTLGGMILPAAALAAAVGVLLGAPLRSRLRAGRYLLRSEAVPAAPHRWVAFGPAVVLALLAARVAADETWGLAPAYLAVALIGVALAAIDLHVHRLPDRLTLHTLPAIFLLLGFAAVLHPDAGSMLSATFSWAGALVVYVGLVLLVPGGMGLGDAKLAALVALVLGWWGYDVAIVGLALGFVVGGLWAAALMLTRRASRHTHFAFGPSILLGGLLALVLAVPGV